MNDTRYNFCLTQNISTPIQWQQDHPQLLVQQSLQNTSEFLLKATAQHSLSRIRSVCHLFSKEDIYENIVEENTSRGQQKMPKASIWEFSFSSTNNGTLKIIQWGDWNLSIDDNIYNIQCCIILSLHCLQLLPICESIKIEKNSDSTFTHKKESNYPFTAFVISRFDHESRMLFRQATHDESSSHRLHLLYLPLFTSTLCFVRQIEV